jgi:glycosyltransferase involved in cell wall biosynthesis
MSVLLVSGDFTPLGGMDRANYELARYLADDLDAKVVLVAYRVTAPLTSHPNVLWRPVPKPLNSYSLGGFFLSRFGRAEARWVAKQQGHVVVNGSNCPWPDINWVHAVQRNWEPRLSHAPARVRLRQRLSRKKTVRAERQALGYARTIITNSERTRHEVTQNFDVPLERVHTIYLGTDPEMFRPASPAEKLAAREQFGWPANTLTAAFIGALGHDRNKGFDILFEAWKQLCSDPAWDVDLVAAGGGAEVPYWRMQAEKSGLGRRIRMIGFTQETPQLLRASDVFIQPSFYEAYGLSAHEALCCGVPALVTGSSGIAERYPAALADFLLDSPPSVRNLVDRLRQWRVEREEWRARMIGFSAQLRQRTWKDMAREFVELTMPALIAPETSAAISQGVFQNRI